MGPSPRFSNSLAHVHPSSALLNLFT